MKRYLIVVSCCFLAMACENDPMVTFKEAHFADIDSTMVEVNIPVAEGNKSITKGINSTIESHIVSALQIGDSTSSTSVQQSIKAFCEEYKSFKNDFPQSSQTWEAQIDGDIMYQSPDIISIALTTYKNTGGAHGIMTITFLNFNGQTGNMVSNDNLFNNKPAFYNLAKTYFHTHVDYKKLVFDTEKFELPANIGYSEKGVILLYNTYEIAPYSAGVIEFTIPYEDVNSLLVFDGTP